MRAEEKGNGGCVVQCEEKESEQVSDNEKLCVDLLLYIVRTMRNGEKVSELNHCHGDTKIEKKKICYILKLLLTIIYFFFGCLYIYVNFV